ncbi:MAG TPA: sigma-70 family RNA polymerase sigma factor [Gemmatimonadaceae bacterium]|nr:sigma-70 family RNA polymerase sigma factor [Gemmatimonadaceae bacterium]
MAESPPPVPPELSALLAAQTGAEMDAAWQRFVNSYSRLLLHAARSAARNYDAGMDSYAYILDKLRADDCARLRAYRANARSRFSTWLVFIARRMCVDRQREQYGRWKSQNHTPEAQQERSARRRLTDLLAADFDLGSVEDSTTPDPEQCMRDAELSNALTRAASTLDPGDQLLLTLRFVDGLSAREIESLNRWGSAALVYRRIDQLKVILRRKLIAEGIDSPVP